MPSESDIIARIRARARSGGRVLVGLGDDAAVLSPQPGCDLIACCDSMVEGIHFRREWTAPDLLGQKALAVTLSDVAAMGGVARFALLSIALPASTSSEFVDDLFRGLLNLADNSGVSLIGGDTSSSPGPIFLDTSAIGECRRGQAVTRGGARPGDLIYVTGELGASALGLKLLEQGHRLEDCGSDVRGRARRQALLKHLAPEPRLKMGRAIGEAQFATSMIDVSDGLSTDLSHLLEESGCGAVVHAAALPIARCLASLASEDSEIDVLKTALHGGEEYELVFTSRPDNDPRIAELARSMGVAVTAIGETVLTGGLRLERNGAIEPLPSAGFEHSI